MSILMIVVFTCWLSTPGKSQVDNKDNIQLQFEHFIDSNILQLNTRYLNRLKEEFTPKVFRYHVSNIAFEDEKGNYVEISNSYFLINESEPESKTISIALQPGNYRSIRFLLGVDSTATVSGIHEGALDPYNGMFWTWNTGFVSAKFEGTSPESKMPQQLFQYHIGGFRKGQNTLRMIRLPFSNTHISESKITSIQIQADIQKWFNGINDLSIAANSFVHTPGKLAVKYADNYAAMFSLGSISTN